MNDCFEDIAALKAEWDALQPLSPENERRLWQKLRLEWNYHSNHIEGNTLTYGETELLLLHDQTHGTHSLREYEEMKAHDVGIEHLRTLASDRSRFLNVGDIRDLNKIILKEPFWKAAETPDGKPTRKQIVPGEYKTTPNNVRTATGEIFEFAPPSEVDARMQTLIEWLSATLSCPSFDLVSTVAKLHHDFVLIHPFDDGNGRVARMLVNYVLLREGFPPIIVPTEEKKEYLAALRLADAGEPLALTDYLTKCLRWVLQLAIRAGNGESIEEPSDIEKEIALFIRSQEHHREKVQPKSAGAIKELYDLSLKELITKSVEKMASFSPLFLTNTLVLEPAMPAGNKEPLSNFESQLRDGFKNPSYFKIIFSFENYRGQASDRFHVQTSFQITFSASDYHILVGNQSVLKKLYSEPIMSDEREDVVRQLLAGVMKEIKQKAK